MPTSSNLFGLPVFCMACPHVRLTMMKGNLPPSPFHQPLLLSSNGAFGSCKVHQLCPKLPATCCWLQMQAHAQGDAASLNCKGLQSQCSRPQCLCLMYLWVGTLPSRSLMPFLLSAGAPIWFNSPELFNSWQAIRGVDLQGHFDYICPLTNKGRLPNILECQYEGTPQVQHLNIAACHYLTHAYIPGMQGFARPCTHPQHCSEDAW